MMKNTVDIENIGEYLLTVHLTSGTTVKLQFNFMLIKWKLCQTNDREYQY